MAKSKLFLEFLQYPLPLNTTVVVEINNGNNVIPVALRAVAQRSAYGQFTVVNDASNAQPAFSFAFSWNIDHKDIGGFDNVKATFQQIGENPGVKIEINNENWTFESAQAPENIISVDIQNTTPPPNKDWSFEITGADCDNANYDITVIGGTPPFTLTGLFSGIQTDLASNFSIQLPRGFSRTLKITDDAGEAIGTKQITPPKVLDASHFTITTSQDIGANVEITSNVIIDSSITPIEYSINGVDYQGAGNFTGLDFQSQYTAYIRDKFGCVRTKVFVTPENLTDVNINSAPRYYEKSNTGTFIFSRLSGTPRNYTNSLSFEELVKLPSETETLIYKDWLNVDQFKSSYTYHKITLVENGNSRFIEPVLQAQNLNVQEKVDCLLFSDINGAMGLYFRNGNKYEPNTTTSIGSSEYSESSLPSWAETGNVINIEGLGLLKIKRVSVDEDRGLYLQINTSFTGVADATARVQVTYNINDYNLYEFAFPSSAITNCARLFIEFGYLIDGEPKIEVILGSERIRKISDKQGFLEMQWNDSRNKGGIVYQTGIINRMLVPYIKWVGNTESKSDIYEGDDETVSLEETTTDTQSLILKVTGYKMQQKIHRATGMEYFAINEINYRKREFTSTPMKSTNKYVMEGTFQFGGNSLQVQNDELVLNPPETPLTSKSAQVISVPNILARSGEGLVYNGEGGFILV